jgi:hypothetical protein
VNQLSDDFGYHGVAFALSTSSIITATVWLRRLPARAPLIRYVQITLLIFAATGAIFAAFAPRAAAGPASLISTAAILVGVLLTASLFQASRMLLGAAIAGFAAGQPHLILVALANQEWLAASHMVSTELACLCACYASIVDSNRLRGIVLLLMAIVSGTAVAILFLFGRPLEAVPFTATLCVAIHFRRRLPKRDVAYQPFVPGILVASQKPITTGTPPTWLCRGIDRFVGKTVLATCFGLALGIVSIQARQELLGAAFLTGSMGCLLRGLHLFRYGLLIQNLRNRVSILTDSGGDGAP